DETDDDHEDGDDHRHDRPVDEELGHGALLPDLGYGQLDLRTGPDLVESLDDDPLAWLHPLLDDPERADPLAELNLSHVHRPVGQDDAEVPQSLRGPTPAPSQILLLADGDLDVDRVELGDRGERGAGLDQVADVCVLDSRDAGDRGEDLRPAGVELGIA